MKSERSTTSDNIFYDIWNIMKEYHITQLFLVSWLFNDEESFKVFVTLVLGLPYKYSKSSFWRVYKKWKISNIGLDRFGVDYWAKIVSVMDQKMNFSKVPKPIREAIHALRDGSGALFCRNRCDSIVNGHCMAINYLHIVSPPPSQSFEGFCVYVPNERETRTLKLQSSYVNHLLIYSIPSDYFPVARRIGDITVFFSLRMNCIVGTWVHDYGIPMDLVNSIGCRLHDLYKGKRLLKRSVKRQSIGGMIASGGYQPRFVPGKNRVTFYTHDVKLSQILGSNDTHVTDCQSFIDKYSHIEIVEIIMGLHMRYNPEVTQAFLEISAPYLTPSQHEETSFEQQLSKRISCGLQLFVTKNYGSMIHSDLDYNDFTLAFVSNPDAASSSLTKVNFVLDGAVIPCGHGDLFSFRGEDKHGTAYRPATSQPAMVGAVTVNRRFGQVLDRRI